MSTTPEEPFVDTDVRGGLTEWIGRILKHATPESLVAGGASDDGPEFTVAPRNHDTLKNREAVYKAGGPVTSIIDSRSLMTFGTGMEFDTENTAVTDDQGRDVADWLTDKTDDWLDLFAIDAGIQSYYAGDAWPEIVETKAGEFDHIGLVDPTTVDASWDEHGQITNLRQVIVREHGRPIVKDLDLDTVFHFTHSNATGGPLGESLIEQNMDEIERFAKNQTQRANAIRLHGSPHYSISVGSEGQSIPDKLMRRVRNQFRSDQVDEETNWVHGGDIEVTELDSPGFEGMGDVTDTDARMLAWSLDYPLEWTNFGSAGLGEGTPAMSRVVKFERQARAEQLRLSATLTDIFRRVLEEYSPFPRDVEFEIRFGDVVSDQQAVADWLSQVGWAFHRDEVRELMDHQPWDDSEDREAPPEVAPEVQQAQGGGDGGGGPLGGGGMLAEPGDDAPDPLDAGAKRQYTDGGVAVEQPRLRTIPARTLLNDGVSHDELTQEELVFEDIVERVLWSDDTERTLFEFDPEEVPQFAVERLRDAIEDGALFSRFESVDSASASQVGDALLDSLDTRHGWSIQSLQDNLQDIEPELSNREAETIARTETQALVSKAREEGYREQFDIEEERFDWVGPSNSRTTEACEWIKDQIPDEGVTMERLKGLIQEANDRFVDHDGREWTPHIQCRHQATRQV